MPKLFLIDVFSDESSIFLNSLDKHGKQHILEITEPRRVNYLVIRDSVDSDESALRIAKEQLVAIDINPSTVYLSLCCMNFLHPVTRVLVSGRTIVKVVFKWTISLMEDLHDRSRRHRMVEWVIGKNISSMEYTISNWGLRGWFSFHDDNPVPLGPSACLYRMISPARTRVIQDQPPPPENPPIVSIYWSAEKKIGHISGSPVARMTLEDMQSHVKATGPIIALVHDRDSIPKELDALLSRTLVVDTYQFAKELIPGKKSYALKALVPDDRTRSASLKIKMLAADMNLVQLLFQISLLTGQPCSKALSKMGRIEWMLSRKFIELSCIPPDKPFGCSADSYKGGHVLEPRKGLFTNPILYFDFRSLYPSICVENDICYSEDGRILPPLMRHLIETRKSLEEEARHSPTVAIRRVCLKLLGNSIYGCLACRYSRFYSIGLAKAITLAGREALVATAHLIKKEFGYDAIYGDTDSLMISMPSTFGDQSALNALARRIVDRVNTRYQYMELQFEGTITELALFSKKCYASVKNGVFEVKGLDMIKRGYAPCGVTVCDWILAKMFENLTQNSDTLRAIYAYTNEVAFPQITGLQLPLSDFIITTQLSKDPSKYTNVAGMYHMQAIANHASATKQRNAFKRGDFVYYVMTTSHGAMLVNATDSVIDYTLDIKWYLTHVTGMVDRLLSIYPAHKISSIFKESSAESDYLSFLPPSIKPRAPKEPTGHLLLREKLFVVCRKCKNKAQYHGFTPLEHHLLSSHGKHSGAHVHVKADDILQALPKNLISCANCSSKYALSRFMKKLNDSERYTFILSTDIYRVCKQTACTHCQTIVWYALKTNGYVKHFVSLLEKQS
jgi:hypothetical protein